MSAPVIFDIAYTPYKLKKGSSEKDIAKHAKERAFFDMSGAENIYNYMTREGKIYGEESKRLKRISGTALFPLTNRTRKR